MQENRLKNVCAGMCVSCHEKCKGAVEKAIVSFMPGCMQIRLLFNNIFILYCSPTNKRMYKFAMFSFSLLLNSSTIKNLLCNDDDDEFVDESEIWEDKQEFAADSKPFGRYFEEQLAAAEMTLALLTSGTHQSLWKLL